MNITVEDISSRLPRLMSPQETELTEVFIEDALEIINTEFLREGRDFEKELSTVVWLEPTAKRVVIDMVSAALVIGENAGVRSLSSTTGSESDSITYMDGRYSSFSGVFLTDEHRKLLGLITGAYPSARSRRPFRYPEVHRGRNYNY